MWTLFWHGTLLLLSEWAHHCPTEHNQLEQAPVALGQFVLFGSLVASTYDLALKLLVGEDLISHGAVL